MKVKEVIERLKQWGNQDETIACVIWTETDIMQVANEIGAPLSTNNINNILNGLESNHDANYGIDWCGIEDAINEEMENSAKKPSGDSYKVKCIKCHEITTIMLTPDQHKEYMKGEKNIQEIVPNLEPDIRELLISGMCGTCFDKIFA